MKPKTIFCHAGCPVCLAAGQSVVNVLDPAKYDIDSVHPGESKTRLKEGAET